MNAVKQRVGSQDQGQAGGPFLNAFRTGMGAIERTVVTAAEIPLTVFSSLGVPDDTTQAAREGHRQMVRGIHGTLDSVATGVVGVAGNVAGKSASLVSTAVSTATKNGSQKS